MRLRKLVSICLAAGALALPAASAPDLYANCRHSCKLQYQFCMKRSFNGAMKHSCAAALKMCKGGCVVQHSATEKSGKP